MLLPKTPKRCRLAAPVTLGASVMKMFSLLLALPLLTGCGASLAQPFDKMKDSSMTVYRLQNYEPPPEQQPAAGGASILPPQLAQAAQALAGLLPPNLLPPGILPGSAPPPAAAQDTPRFHGSRILSFQQIADSKLRENVLEIFGKEGNFSDRYENCPFYEFGFAISQPNNLPPADIMVSLSCVRVQAYNFTWPYAKIGIPPETSKKIAEVVQRAFGTGT